MNVDYNVYRDLINYKMNKLQPPYVKNTLWCEILFADTLDTLHNSIRRSCMPVDNIFDNDINNDAIIDVLNSLYIKVGLV